MIFTPLSPVVDDHVLVVPRRHAVDAAEDPPTTARTMLAAAMYAAEHYKEFNIITSAGKAATQSIFHLHLHLIPRTSEDGLMVPWGTIYGEDPSAPHWCNLAKTLQGEVERLSAK